MQLFRYMHFVETKETKIFTVYKVIHTDEIMSRVQPVNTLFQTSFVLVLKRSFVHLSYIFFCCFFKTVLFLVIERDYINLSRNILQVFTVMSWCGTFLQEARKAQVQFYLVNALGIIHVYSIIKEATQQQKLQVIPLSLELLSQVILLLPDCYFLLLLVRVVDQSKRVSMGLNGQKLSRQP